MLHFVSWLINGGDNEQTLAVNNVHLYSKSFSHDMIVTIVSGGQLSHVILSDKPARSIDRQMSLQAGSTGPVVCAPPVIIYAQSL